MADDFGYHIDHHGSLARPAELLTARSANDPVALAAAQEQAVVAAAHAQRRLGLSAISDGQFRRSSFESVAYDNIDGFTIVSGMQPLADAAGIAWSRRRAAPAQPVARGRLAQAEVAPVLATVDRHVFVQLPSPGYLAALGSPLASWADVDAVRAAGEALAPVLRAEIEALAADGVGYVALGNPLYPPLLTLAGRERLAAVLAVDAVLQAMLAADRAVFTGLNVPANFRIGLDLTDAGALPTTERGYDAKALDTLLDGNPFHRLCVDFPADPIRRLPVEQVPLGIVLSLGVVDVTDPTLETVDSLLERIDPVFGLRGEPDTAIATNGGFASIADQPTAGAELQTEKLRLVEMVARYYWGNEI
jgi:5-methyltetrahydropteroyltriglutamate--homocysteine methyltransferase